jgi:hypothetical protein
MDKTLKSSFRTPYDQYRERQGQPFTILRTIDTPDDQHDEEVLPMYEIQFTNDGAVIEAWPEEIFDLRGDINA